MAAFIWKLKIANEEVTRLEKENGELKEQLKQAAESPGGDVIKAAEAQAVELESANGKISALQSNSAQLISENATLKSDLSTTRTALTAAQATIADPKGAIETRSSVIAREIISATVGNSTPLKAAGQENPSGLAKPDLSKLTGLAKVIACEKFEAAQKALNTR